MTQQVIVFTAEPQPPAPLWPAYVAAALVLALAVALAWWRVHRPRSGTPRRRTRIVVAAIMGGVGAMTLRIASGGTRPDVSAWGPNASERGLIAAFDLLSYVLLAGLLVGTGDLLFDALRPSRNRFWLIAGAPLFALFIGGTLYATGSVGSFSVAPTAQQATLVISALAAGLVWWAWLPTPPDAMAGIFE